MSSTNENAATVAGDKPKTAGNGTRAIVATPSLGPSAASAAPTVPDISATSEINRKSGIPPPDNARQRAKPRDNPGQKAQ
jgi:hypothetical protein